jgi:hypothetical protein
MHPRWSLLAQADPAPAPPKAPSLLEPQLLWATAALVVTLLLGALVISLFDRWRKRADPAVLTPAEQLAAFRLSYERGELSQEEYERIRARLAPRLREQLNLPPAQAPGAAPPPAEPSGNGPSGPPRTA